MGARVQSLSECLTRLELRRIWINFAFLFNLDNIGSKKKVRRSRGLSTVSQASSATLGAESASYNGMALATPQKGPSASNSTTSTSSIHHQKHSEMNGDLIGLSSTQQHQLEPEGSDCTLLRENAQRMSEIRQLQKERQKWALELYFRKIVGDS